MATHYSFSHGAEDGTTNFYLGLVMKEGIKSIDIVSGVKKYQYNIIFDDGDVQNHIPRGNVRIIKPRVGSIVSVYNPRWKGNNIFYILSCIAYKLYTLCIYLCIPLS